MQLLVDGWVSGTRQTEVAKLAPELLLSIRCARGVRVHGGGGVVSGRCQEACGPHIVHRGRTIAACCVAVCRTVQGHRMNMGLQI